MSEASWIARARRRRHSGPGVFALSLQYQSEVLERSGDVDIGRVECPLSQLNASLQDLQGVVVPARTGQARAQVVERCCDIAAVGSGTPLAEADGSPRDSDGLVEVDGGGEHIAKIQREGTSSTRSVP